MGNGRVIVAGIALLLAGHDPAHAQAASPFDGDWAVTIVCEKAADGAAGYSLQFRGHVAGGALVAENGISGDPGYVKLAGQIQPDGSALLSADGLTNAPIYTLGRVAPLTRYHYTVRARFTGNQGVGTRIQARHCDLQFVRS